MACYVEKSRGPTKKEYAEWQKMGYLGTWERYSKAKESNLGSVMFITGDLGPHCTDCAAIGDLLCDYPVGDGKTCDRPMCEDHGAEIGFDLHYCHAHHAMWTEFKNNGGVDEALRNVIAFKPEK